MRKTGILFMLFLMCFFAGCRKEEISDRESIEVKKGGTIVETVRESFGEEYYSEKELKEFIKTEISAYNSSFDKEHIKLNSCDVKDSMAVVTMTYDSSSDYVAFNDMELFADDLSSLIGTEYHGYVELKDSEGESVSLSNIIASGDSYKVLVVTQDCDVKVSGKIIYVSDGVEILSGKTADVTISDEASAYIIYK